MSKNTTIGLVALVLVVLAGWYFVQSQKSQAPSPATESAQPAEAMEKNVVKITSSGFMPKDLTIKAGESVTWMNDDTLDHTVNSAVHPTHQVYLPLNLGTLQSGEKKSLNFPEAGSYKYHDHLNPTLFGSVTVE